MTTTKGHEMTPEQRLQEMREKAQGKPVDWAAVRRSSAAKGNRTEDDWDLVDAFAS